MSEEKLYAVENDDGKYWDFSGKVTGFWDHSSVEVPVTGDKDLASALANAGGHVVTFVEEPKKTVLTEEQAEIVDDAHEAIWPATYISGLEDSSEQRLLIEAYVNGYTVAKEKKYLVYKVLGGKQKNKEVAQAYRSVVFPNTITWSIQRRESLSTLSPAQFTEAEIEHYGLQDCEKEEATDGGIR